METQRTVPCALCPLCSFSTYSNRIEKFLQRHGFKFSSVVNSIMGVSSQRMLYMLANKGVLSLEDVQVCCHHSLRKTPEEIHRAIVGCLNETECKVLKLLLHWCEQLKAQIHELDSLLAVSSAEYASQILLVTGIPGVSNDSALEILSEISPTPQNDFDSAEKLCSWAGLVPRNDESAGIVKSRRILHGNPYVKSILVQCAWAAVKTRNSEFSRWFWARQDRIGRKKAIIAVVEKYWVAFTLCFSQVNCIKHLFFQQSPQPPKIVAFRVWLSLLKTVCLLTLFTFFSIFLSTQTVPCAET